jgi:hypothetical protein
MTFQSSESSIWNIFLMHIYQSKHVHFYHMSTMKLNKLMKYYSWMRFYNKDRLVHLKPMKCDQINENNVFNMFNYIVRIHH